MHDEIIVITYSKYLHLDKEMGALHMEYSCFPVLHYHTQKDHIERQSREVFFLKHLTILNKKNRDATCKVLVSCSNPVT
jgi:hypothetical protein